MREPYHMPALRVLASVATATLVVSIAKAEEPKQLPPVTVEAGPPRSPLLPSPAPGSGGPPGATAGPAQQTAGNGKGHSRCVDMAIGNDTSLGCLNEKLRQKVDEVNPPVLNTPPIDARSSDLKVGTVNIPAVQQQYGRNFGISAVPYRPTVTYPSGMGRR